MSERLDNIGYINEAHEHILLGFHDPAILNPSVSPEKWVQVAITIETAKALQSELSKFLSTHCRAYN